MLARAEAGQLRVEMKTVDLSAMLAECWALVDDRATSRGLSVRWTVPPECLVRSDADKLRIVIQNLFDNVVSHADENGDVRVTARGETGKVFLDIANTAKGLAGRDVHRVFDRFWRADSSRTDTATHSGLGLSLCRRLADLLAGEISATATEAGEFQITLQLPAA
jgi:signal transduction histidine kinase